jgi:alcohol dehydrogenase class IV
VHGIAGPLGGMINAPHGAVCARLLPEVTAANVSGLGRISPHHHFTERFRELARILTGRPEADTREGIRWLQHATRELDIPPLTQWGLKEEDVSDLVLHAQRASSMRGNPVKLDRPTLETVIRQAMQEGEH